MNTTGLTQNFKTFLFWGIGALALIALAEYQPSAAIIFTVILLVGVLLTHWSQFSGLLTVQKSTTSAQGG